MLYSILRVNFLTNQNNLFLLFNYSLFYFSVFVSENKLVNTLPEMRDIFDIGQTDLERLTKLVAFFDHKLELGIRRIFGHAAHIESTRIENLPTANRKFSLFSLLDSLTLLASIIQKQKTNKKSINSVYNKIACSCRTSDKFKTQRARTLDHFFVEVNDPVESDVVDLKEARVRQRVGIVKNFGWHFILFCLCFYIMNIYIYLFFLKTFVFSICKWYDREICVCVCVCSLCFEFETS